MIFRYKNIILVCCLSFVDSQWLYRVEKQARDRDAAITYNDFRCKIILNCFPQKALIHTVISCNFFYFKITFVN